MDDSESTKTLPSQLIVSLSFKSNSNNQTHLKQPLCPGWCMSLSKTMLIWKTVLKVRRKRWDLNLRRTWVFIQVLELLTQTATDSRTGQQICKNRLDFMNIWVDGNAYLAAHREELAALQEASREVKLCILTANSGSTSIAAMIVVLIALKHVLLRMTMVRGVAETEERTVMMLVEIVVEVEVEWDDIYLLLSNTCLRVMRTTDNAWRTAQTNSMDVCFHLNLFAMKEERTSTSIKELIPLVMQFSQLQSCSLLCSDLLGKHRHGRTCLMCEQWLVSQLRHAKPPILNHAFFYTAIHWDIYTAASVVSLSSLSTTTFLLSPLFSFISSVDLTDGGINGADGRCLSCLPLAFPLL